MVDHLSEHLDRCSLGADDLVADDARDDLVVADAPHGDALIPLDQRLGEPIQVLVLASMHVELHELEPGLRHGGVEGLAERRCDAPHLPEAG